MEEFRNVRLRFLSFLVIAYMIMAFTWWSVLLFTKNRDAFHAKQDLLRIGMVAQGIVRTEEEFYQTTRYLDLERRYRRQEWMILGEASVFVLSLVAGIWLINRGYHREMTAAQQRRNFLLSITHELKSPLASIRLVLETILKRDLNKELKERLSQNALKETDRLTNLVDDLLLSAKLETAYQLNLETIDLAHLLEDIIQKLIDKFPNARFSFQVEGTPPSCFGDRLGLTSVALNLLENAVKYSSLNPEVEMTLRFDEQLPGFLIRIADNGIGIPDREKKKIFEKFYRVGNENTRISKGTGLGLYIVDQIVKAHGGKIQVTDNQPSGTVFLVSLPLH